MSDNLYNFCLLSFASIRQADALHRDWLKNAAVLPISDKIKSEEPNKRSSRNHNQIKSLASDGAGLMAFDHPRILEMLRLSQVLK